jgi:hypothetical protein
LPLACASGEASASASSASCTAPAPAADHHRQALELRVAQQLDGRVERVHVEVGDAASGFSNGWKALRRACAP